MVKVISEEKDLKGLLIFIRRNSLISWGTNSRAIDLITMAEAATEATVDTTVLADSMLVRELKQNLILGDFLIHLHIDLGHFLGT